MKTIAITIDEKTLALIDELHAASGTKFPSRSAFIRAAIDEFLDGMTRRLQEERESQVIQRNKELLAKQLRAAVEEQAT